MQVSVETTKGLERKLTIQVPSEQFEEEVDSRLKELSKKVKIDGFRPGKVPLSLVKKRFSGGVRGEVADEMVKKTLFEAINEQKLSPAGQPYVEPTNLTAGEDFVYTAVFEIFPEFEPKEFDNQEIERVVAEISDTDLDSMIEKLREQQKNWNDVERAVVSGDKVEMDFDGSVDGEAFEGGAASNHELIIGSGSMIPGFEEGMIGAEIGTSFDLNVTFPEDYNHEDLAGKAAVFKVVVNKISEGSLPELNDEFAEKFNISEGGVEALKKDIRQNMERELERKVKAMNKENVFNLFLTINDIDLPTSMIDQEINNLKQEMMQRVFGNQQVDMSKLPDLPNDMFEEQARRRVQLGLLVSEYIKKHEIESDSKAAEALLEKMAEAYEKPEELTQWYRSDKQRMAEIEAAVLEDQVVDKICENAIMIEKQMDYDSIMNPKEQDKDE